MHTPDGFTPLHVTPPALVRERRWRSRSPARGCWSAAANRRRSCPRSTIVARAGLDGVHHYLGQLQGADCVAVGIARRCAGARRLRSRRTALAVPAPAGSDARARGPRVPGRRMGSHAPLLRPLRHADARQGRRARQGVPGLRLRRLSARFAGDDGARHARPRVAARARQPLSAARCTARSRASSSRAKRSRTASTAKCARKSASTSPTSQYFASQSWAFPHSLMIAYTAELRRRRAAARSDRDRGRRAGSPSTRCPTCRRTVSIARRLIDATVARLRAQRRVDSVAS